MIVRSAIAVLCILVAAGCWAEREVVLRCDYGNGLRDVYSLHEQDNSVRLMSVDPPRPGLLKVSESVYQLKFPEDNPAPGYLLLIVDVNRFTSKATREIGRDRTIVHEGQPLKLYAQQDSGECVRMEGVAF
jgi:hypothetical protein